MLDSSHNDTLTAVILAGGQGTRLRPFTTSLPKPLVPIGEHPIIEILLHRLRIAGVTTVHIAVNHLAEQIEQAVGDGNRFGMTIHYAHEPKPLSTVGPLTLIDNLPERFLVCNGDIISDIDLSMLFDSHIKSACPLTVAVKNRTDRINYGVLQLDQSNRVRAFQEKPTVSHSVSMGLYVFSRSVLEHAPGGERFGFDDLMLRLLAEQIPINAVVHDGYWLDIGRPEDYERALADQDKILALLDQPDFPNH